MVHPILLEANVPSTFKTVEVSHFRRRCTLISSLNRNETAVKMTYISATSLNYLYRSELTKYSVSAISSFSYIQALGVGPLHISYISKAVV